MELIELLEIITSEYPSIEIKENENSIFEMIPELELCKGFNQNNNWHIYDVYEHILHVVDNVSDNPKLRLAALFHDVGKPLTYKEDENKIGHFYNHWKVSMEIFLNFARKYKLDNKFMHDVAMLINYHDKNLDINKAGVINIIREIGLENIPLIFDLKRADLLAQSPRYYYLLDKYDIQEEKIKYLKRNNI